MNLSKTYLIGRLVSEPIKKEVGNGLTNATVITNETVGDKEYPSYHKVVAWGELAEELSKLKKGKEVFIEGKNKTRSYDKDGEKRYITEVVIEELEYSSAEKGTLGGILEKKYPWINYKN